MSDATLWSLTYLVVREHANQAVQKRNAGDYDRRDSDVFRCGRVEVNEIPETKTSWTADFGLCERK